MIIRELIARFGFDVDEKGAKQVDKRIDGMKKGISSLGKLMGVSLGAAGAKAFFKMSQTAERAEFNLKRMAGTDFKALRQEFNRIQQEIDKTREGASKVITERQFDVAAANFLKVFGKGEKQIQSFAKIFEFSAKQAAITGQEVTDIISEIQSGIQGGGFDAFLDLPGFDVFRKQFLEFQQAAIDPGDPGGRIALQNRLKAVIGIVTESARDQNEELRKIPDELLEVDKAGAKTQDTLEKLGKTVNNTLTPAWQGLNVILGHTNDLLNATKEEHKGAFKEVSKDLFPAATSVFSAISGFLDPKPQAIPGQTTPGKSGDTITVRNTFTIPNTDPREVAKIATEVMNEGIKNAKRSIVKTEE
jgi:hypothetical protein